MIRKSRKTAAILCSAVSALCFITAANLRESTEVSYAQEGSVQEIATEFLFTKDSYALHTYKGLKVNTKEDDASVNGLLNGDFSLKYAYTQTGYGETEFAFYDKDEPTEKVFSLYRSFSSENLGSACVVDYRGAEKAYYILGKQVTGTLNVYFCNPSANTTDQKEVYPTNANSYYGVEGELTLTWEGDTLSVGVSRGWDGVVESVDVMASLDLPNFKDGYIMRVEGSSLIRGKGGDASIVLTEMNGLELYNAAIEGVTTAGKISYDGEYLDDSQKPAIDLTIGDELGSFVYTQGVVLDCTENGFGSIYVETKKDELSASSSYAEKVAGRYVEQISAYGTTKEYAIYVSDSGVVTVECLLDENSGASFVAGQGLQISTKRSTASVNGVLSGDFSLEYVYTSASYGESEFAFYDKDDLTKKVFSVYRSFAQGNYGCACVIDYRGSSLAYIAGTSRNNINTYSWQYFGGTGGFGIASEEVYPSCGGYYNVVGEIKLTWTNHSVAIGVTVGANGVAKEVKTMATLDLPNFKDGYVVKVEPSAKMRNKNGHDGIILKKLNKVGLTTSTVAARLVGKELSNTSAREVDGKQVIDIIQGSQAPDFTLQYLYSVAGITVSAPYEKFPSPIDVTSLPLGTHERSVSYKGITRNFVFNVGAGCNVEELFTAESKAEYVQVDSNVGVVKGVKVVPKTNPARLNGTFKGDLDLEYSYGATGYGAVRFDFYDKDNLSSPVFSVYRSRYTTQTGMQTFGNAFVIYGGKYYALEAAYDTVEAVEEASKNYNFYPVNNAHSQNTGTDKWALAGHIRLQWTGNTVAVKLSVGAGAVVTGEVTMATLSLADFSDGYVVGISDAKEIAGRDNADQIVLLSVNGKSLAEPFIQYDYLPVGVTYGGVMKNGVIYVAQNGRLGAFTSERGDVCYASGWYKESISLGELVRLGLHFDYTVDLTTVGNKTLSVTPVLNGKRGEAIDFDLVVEPSTTISLQEKNGMVIDEIYYSENTWQSDLPVPQKANWKFGGWYDQNGELVERLSSFSGLTPIALTARWYDDVAPEIAFNEGVQAITKSLGERLTSLGFSANDVTAYDAATDRLFTGSDIQIYVKEPNGETFVAYGSFVFNATKYGAYVIRYEATDAWVSVGDTENSKGHAQNNTAYVERVIYYAAERPQIEVNGTVAETAYVGVEIVLPVAAATRGGESVESFVNVSYVSTFGESGVVELHNGAFTPHTQGTYSVVYYAKDDCGQTASQRYTVEVVVDGEKPLIEVEFAQKTAYVGKTFTVPVATATDAVDGAVAVVTEVWFKNQLLGSGAFEPKEEGLYVVRYTATDKSGNKTVSEYELIVTKGKSTSANKNEPIIIDSEKKNDYVWAYIVGGVVVVAAVVVTLAVVIRKKKNKA